MAEGVERFELRAGECDGPRMNRSTVGRWVRYPDYEKLEAERNAGFVREGELMGEADRFKDERDQALQALADLDTLEAN